MIKKVRQGCFETNSSSQHSIIVTKNNTHITTRDLTADYNDPDYNQQEHIYIGDDNKINLYDIDEGFGRSPFKFLTSFNDKLQYAMCEFLGHKYVDDDDYEEIYNEFLDIVREFIPECEDFYIPTRDEDIYLDEDGNQLKRRDVKYDHWENGNAVYVYVKDGITKEATVSETDYYEVPNIGIIDHQSSGTLTNFLKEKNISLKEFLTNKKYIIVIDGDEYCELENMINNNILNKDYIEEIYPTCGEDIEYQEWLKEQNNE